MPSMTLVPNFVAKTNSVLPLAQQNNVLGIAIRAASGGTDILGTLTAVGAAGVVAFTLSPETPAWVTGQVDSTGLIFSVSFSNAVPNGTIPYEFYVIATDGVTTLYFPILLDVKPPLSLGILSGPYTGLTTLSVPSYDSTIADIVIQPLGLANIPVSGVSFIQPAAPPTGLNLLTSDGTSLTLHVSDPSPSNISGGLQTFINQPVTTQLVLLAYAPGFFYDEPDRAFQQIFTIQSLTAKAGTLDFMVSVYYNVASGFFRLDMDNEFIQGQGASEAINILWTASPTGGAAGSPNSGTGATFQWTPSAGGGSSAVSFTVTLQGATTSHIYGTKTIGPISVGGSNLASWSGTNALKLVLDKTPNAAEYTQYATLSWTVTVSSPASEMAGGETVTVTFPALETGSPIETPISGPASIMLTSGNGYSNSTTVVVPASTIKQKWGLRCNAVSSTARSGFAEALLESNGSKSLVINNTSGLTSTTGSAIAPYQLTATDVVTVAPIAATFKLVGAPDGLLINGSNQIVGNALLSGTYTFQVLAEAAGYVNTLSNNFVLTVTQNATPLVITNPVVIGDNTVPPIQTNNVPFTVAWSITGLATSLNFLQSGSLSGPRNVINATQAATSQPTTSVITIYGTSFFGNAYSVPLIVLSSSIQASEQLLPSPTIGTIDENFNLTLNWQPFIVAGGFTIYKAWDIFLNQPPNTPPLGLQTINGALPTGLEFPGSTVSNRIFKTLLKAGDWTASMTALTSDPAIATNSNPWDNPKLFPTQLTPANIQLSSTTLQLGQTLTINLDPAYSGANFWSITYEDGTTTGFLPISARSQAKAFTQPGQQNIVIETEFDYSNSVPPVKLRRSLTLSIYVTNQQFTPTPSSTSNLDGTLGIGGEQGFEIVNATNAAVQPNPWELINRALVRDEVTNELKLMVATSRFASASSLLDTLAVDFFPILQRPLSLDPLEIQELFQTTSSTTATPVKITTTALPTIIVGKPMTSFQLQATAGTPSYSWFTDSSLPGGLKLSVDGTLYGTPLELGTFSINFSVQDSSIPATIATIVLPITIQTDMVITTTSPLPPATVNTPYNLQFTNIGGLPPFTWSIPAGAFASGLTIDPQTGILSGVPVTYNSTKDFNTTFTGTVQIQDTIGAIVTKVFTMQLLPAAFQFGPFVDQTTIYATEQFKLVASLFGGTPPYTLVSFTDDGIIGSGLQIVNPTADTVTLVAGTVPPVLTLTTSPGPTPFYPQVYPQNISFNLLDFTSGGTPPYNWSITSGAPNTLANAAIFGNTLTGTVSVNGFVTVGVTVVDSIGHIAQGVFSLFSQKQDDATVGFQIFPVAVTFSGTQSNPFNWLVLPITNPPTTSPQSINNTTVPPAGPPAPFPDAKVGQAYTPANVDANIFAATSSHTIYQNYQFFGFAVYQNGKLHLTQNGAPSKVWVANSAFNLGDTIQDTNGNLEIVTTAGTTGAIEPTNWSTTGGTTTDGTVVWTESVIHIPGQMVFLTVGEDEEPSQFPNWINVQNGTTVAGGAFRDFSGIVLFNVTGGSSPVTNDAYNFLSQYTSIVATTGNLAVAAQRESITVTSTGAQLPPPAATAQVIINATDFFPQWQPSTGYVVNQQILDLNGYIQQVTSIAPPGVSGSAIPNWNKLQGGTTGDNQVTWTNEGLAETLVINLTTLQNPNNNAYNWYDTIVAEGGTGPYSFQIISTTPSNGLPVNPTTLPGVTTTTLNNLPAIASNSTQAGAYQVSMIAIDSLGHQSPAATINVTLLTTAQQQVHILNNNLPTTLFGPAGFPGELGRPIPTNTFFIQADLVSNWTATGLPGGVTFTTNPSNRAYLQGTPTSSGTFNVSVTAISASYGTQDTFQFTLIVTPRSAVIATPLPTQATVGLDYRAVNNNAIFKVNYVGYQPTDADLPLLVSVSGTVGAPGVTNAGLPTTQVTNLTPNGFTMLFDYQNNIIGSDTVTLKHNLNIFPPQVTLNVVFSPLIATGTTPAVATVSEYAITATIQPPVSIQGGNPPYLINITGESDPRFVPQLNNTSNASLLITVANFAPGQTYPCQVQMTVTDTEGTPQTSITTGTVQVFVKQETFITVNYNNQTWNASANSVPNIYFLTLPNGIGAPSSSGPGVKVILGHTPFQYNVTGVTIPGGLTGKVTVSPSNRVIAINTVGSSVNVNDVGSNLAPQGSFTVPSTAAPSIGQYTINVSYQVIDANGITSSGSANVIVNIS